LTEDGDILRRRWLLVDADPNRKGVVGSSDDEKAKAYEVIRAVREQLARDGWPEPVICDSGMGTTCFIGSICQPMMRSGQESLEALSRRFSTDTVKIDTSVSNPSRITKLYGTKVCKGPDTPDRPHRLSGMLEVPSEREVVPMESLEKLAATAKAADVKPTTLTQPHLRSQHLSPFGPSASLYQKNGAGCIWPRWAQSYYHVACILILGFGLSIDQAMPLFREWNNTLDEKWTERASPQARRR